MVLTIILLDIFGIYYEEIGNFVPILWAICRTEILGSFDNSFGQRYSL